MDPTALDPGLTIGHYVIERLVAVGGSSAVYEARDPRACRTVAIKLLLADPESDPERGRRLLHEARAYTRLVHPRIVTLYEVGEYQGRIYLVMEWIAGVTLADRLVGGALDQDEALRVMAQVADGLSVAHALGLAHRDLKPANIMLTPESEVKLLDFGLVKPVALDSAVPTTMVTVDGGIRGTPAYMSPEQVRGEELSLASDVFSFGAVLFELISGTPAFLRSSILETLNAVTAGTPPRLPKARGRRRRNMYRLIRRCLQLEPEDRPRDARELVVELDRLSRPVDRAPMLRNLVAMLLLACGAAVGGACLAKIGSELASERTPSIAGAAQVLPAEGQMPALFPDGSAFVYLSVDAREIWLSPVGNGNPELVWAGSSQIDALTISGDARSVLFSAQRGNAPSWVWEVPIEGGLPRKVTRGRTPALSPDGERVAAIENTDARHSRLIICQRDGTERRVLHDFEDSSVAYSCCFADRSRGILVVMSDGLRWSELVEIPLDRDEIRSVVKIRGTAREGVVYLPDLDCALWCVKTQSTGPSMLRVTDLRSGKTRSVYPGPGQAEFPSIAQDGVRLAFQLREYSSELVEIAIDPESGAPTSSLRVLPGTRGGMQPRVSPGRDRLVFQSARGDLWIMQRDTGSMGPLLTTGEASFNPAWSPDGRMIAYSCIKNDRSALWIAGADGSDPRQVTDGEFNCFQPVWLPSGERLLFIADRDGTEDLYCMSVHGRDLRRLNHDGAANPAVSPDGRRVVFGVPRISGPVLRMSLLDREQWSLETEWERPIVVNRWAGGKPRFSPDGAWVAFDQPTGPAGGDIFALPVAGGAKASPIRLTALPFPASLVGWMDWAESGVLVVSVARNPHRLVVLDRADVWIRRSLGS